MPVHLSSLLLILSLLPSPLLLLLSFFLSFSFSLSRLFFKPRGRWPLADDCNTFDRYSFHSFHFSFFLACLLNSLADVRDRLSRVRGVEDFRAPHDLGRRVDLLPKPREWPCRRHAGQPAQRRRRHRSGPNRAVLDPPHLARWCVQRHPLVVGRRHRL